MSADEPVDREWLEAVGFEYADGLPAPSKTIRACKQVEDGWFFLLQSDEPPAVISLACTEITRIEILQVLTMFNRWVGGDA